MANLDNYITLEEFSNMVDIKETTIKKNYKKIPGIEIIDGEYYVLKGTRYPGKVNMYKIETLIDKEYVMLKLTSQFKYIDHKMLKIYQNDFNNMTNSLVEKGYLIKNDSLNKYGLNEYYCPVEVRDIFKTKKREQAIELLFKLGPLTIKITNSDKKNK